MATQINLAYTTAKNILAKKGYGVDFKKYRKGTEEESVYIQLMDAVNKRVATSFSAGSLSAASLNLYLMTNYPQLFLNSALFALDGGVGAGVESGGLAWAFPLAAKGDRAEGFQQDMLVYNRFMSVKEFDYKNFDYTVLDDGLSWDEGIKVEDDPPYRLRGHGIEYLFPKRPFYLVVKNMHEDTKKVFVEELGYFVNLTKGGNWCVSNWEGAQYLLPPNSVVLDNKKIDMERALEIPDRPNATAAVAEKVEPCTVDDPTDPLPLAKIGLNNFLQKPCYATYREAFVGNRNFLQFMRRYKEEVYLGSNKYSTANLLRKRMGGSWLDMWKNILELSQDDEKSAMYVLGSICSQLKEKDGKPFFKE